MGKIIFFLLYAAAHIPVAIVEHNAKTLDPPKIQVIGGTDISHPIIRIQNSEPNTTTEICYLLLKADLPFLTRETSADIEVVPGVAPCRVQVRARNVLGASKWSKPLEIKLIENDSIFGLTVKNGY